MKLMKYGIQGAKTMKFKAIKYPVLNLKNALYCVPFFDELNIHEIMESIGTATTITDFINTVASVHPELSKGDLIDIINEIA